jgi:hypothetical protein
MTSATFSFWSAYFLRDTLFPVRKAFKAFKSGQFRPQTVVQSPELASLALNPRDRIDGVSLARLGNSEGLTGRFTRPSVSFFLAEMRLL